MQRENVYFLKYLRENYYDIILTLLLLLSIFFSHLPDNNGDFVSVRTLSIPVLIILLLTKREFWSFLGSPEYKKLLLFFVALILYLAVSLLWSANQIYGIKKLTRLTFDILPVVTCSMFYISYAKDGRFNNLLVSIVILGCLLAFFLLLQNGISYYNVNENWFKLGHIGAGRFLAIGLTVTGILGLLSDRKILIICGCIIVAGLFISGLRAAYTGTIITFIVLIIFLFNKESSRLLFLLKFSAAIMLSVIVLQLIFESPAHRLNSIIDFDNYYNDSSIYSRLDALKISSNIISENFFFGAGLGAYSDHSLNFLKDMHYPHNIFLEFFTELGLIGFIFIVTITTNIILVTKEINFYLLLIFLLCLWLVQFGGNITDQKMIFVFSGFLFFDKKYFFMNK